MSTTHVFRVAYIHPPMYPSFIESLAAHSGIELVQLDAATPPEQVKDILADCHGYYVRAARDELPAHWRVTSELLAFMPKLLIVASYGAGYDTIDVAACSAVGVVAVNQAGGNAQAVAEHAVGMMMTLLKRIPQGDRALRSGTMGSRESLMGRELAGKTIGLVGLGHIGTRTASLVKAFGCETLAVDPYVDVATCAARGASKVDMTELLARCDVVSAHYPLTDETHHLFDASKFAAMRPQSLFINTTRGGTYDEQALYQALASGHLAAAGIDVWDHEPPAADHPLLSHVNVLATPHTGGVTHESRNRVAQYAAEAFVAVARGALPRRIVNPDVIPRFTERLQMLGAAEPVTNRLTKLI